MEQELLFAENSMAFDFEAPNSYQDFISTKKREGFDYQLIISNKEKKQFKESQLTDFSIFKLMFNYKYEIINEYSYSVNILDYLLYKIFNNNAFLKIHPNQLLPLWNLFNHNIQYTYWNWTEGFSKEKILEGINKGEMPKNDVLVFFNFLRAYKLNQNKQIPISHKKESKLTDKKTIEATSKKFFTIGEEKVYYTTKNIENQNLSYIISCVLLHSKELYFIYTGNNSEFLGAIVDDESLGKYLEQGCTVVNISLPIQNIFKDIIGEEHFKKREKAKSRKQLFKDVKALGNKDGKITIQIEVERNSPKFMSGKRQTSDISQYKTIEEFVGDFGEVTKTISKGQTKSIKAKKKFIYNQLKGKK